MSYPIETVEGIAKTQGAKLRKAGISSTAAMLEKCKAPKGRKELAKDTGIPDKNILKWANMCDLMRVKGIGEEYSELLEVAGVDTVKELRNRKPENLQKALKDANDKRKGQLVRQLPGLKQCQNWVKHAKELKPMMTY